MATLNISSIRQKINSAKKIELKASEIADKTFNESKIKFINEFNLHPITKEIEQGPKASNSSNTLDGIGNLFSFIGFDKSSNPTADVRNFILNKFKLKQGKKVEKGNKAYFKYKIQYPGLEDIKSISPMPWEGGRSWVSAIERGISGFSYYMYKKFAGENMQQAFNEGRSGEGLQYKDKVRSANYKPTKYMSEMIMNFTKNLRKNIK
jgi:hypothetical protein